MQKIFVNKNLESFNEEFLKHNATSIQHQLSGSFNFLVLLKRILSDLNPEALSAV